MELFLKERASKNGKGRGSDNRYSNHDCDSPGSSGQTVLWFNLQIGHGQKFENTSEFSKVAQN
jgi:hypothetical protein